MENFIATSTLYPLIILVLIIRLYCSRSLSWITVMINILTGVVLAVMPGSVLINFLALIAPILAMDIMYSYLDDN